MKTEVRTLGVLAYAALLAAVLVPITGGTAALAQDTALSPAAIHVRAGAIRLSPGLNAP